MPNSREIVQSWFDLIGKGQAQAAFALFADDVVYDLKGTTPVSGTYRGLKSIVEDFFTPWWRPPPTARRSPEEIRHGEAVPEPEGCVRFARVLAGSHGERRKDDLRLRPGGTRREGRARRPRRSACADAEGVREPEARARGRRRRLRERGQDELLHRRL